MFRRKRNAGDFNAEIESLIWLEAERLREQGLSEEDARAAARRALGNLTRAHERFYESDPRGAGHRQESDACVAYEVNGNHIDVLKIALGA